MSELSHEPWLKLAARLRVENDKNTGFAPHQPLLLLVVAGLVESGELNDLLLPLTGQLTFRFLTIGTITSLRRTNQLSIRLPLTPLFRQGFWTTLDENGNATSDRSAVYAMRLEFGFFEALQDAEFRAQLRRVLIARYFVDAAERAALYEFVGLPVPPDAEVKQDATRYEATRQKGREARFRDLVIPAYNYTCALFHYRVDTVESGSIVDAAHIHQFAKSRNNEPQNGLALCKNAHWMFDEGLWSIDDEFRVLVAKFRFHEAGNPALWLQNLEGQRIHLPNDPQMWPFQKHLEWHRKYRFGKPRKA